MSRLIPQSPLFGFKQKFNDLRISELADGELVSLAFARGQEKQAAALFRTHFGHPPPEPNRMVKIKTGLALWTAPDQYMIVTDNKNINIDNEIGDIFKDHTYTTLQTDSWASINIEGPCVHDVLERFIALDLRRKQAGFASRTSAHHMTVIVIKTGATDYRLLTPRSSARSFLHALTDLAHHGD